MKCLTGYQDCLNDFIEKYTNEVVINMIQFQNTFNQSHDGLVYIKSKIDWERIIKNNIFNHLKKHAENFCSKNELIFLMDLLVLYFKNAYIVTFQKILEAKTEKSKDTPPRYMFMAASAAILAVIVTLFNITGKKKII